MASLAPVGRSGCIEKRRLLDEYEAATARFSNVVTMLQRKMGTSLKDEYDRLNRLADEARIESEQARLLLEKHTATQ